MTSNHSFFKLQRELIRRNIILPILSGVGFFFTLPLITLMLIQNEYNRLSGVLSEYEIKKDIEEIARNLLSSRYDGVKIGMVIMAVLSGIMLFRYLHSRKQVDFYHSLPISRSKLFAQLYVTGFMSVIPAYIIMYVIAIIISLAMGASSVITAGMIFEAIISNILFFLLFYSITILATVLTGNSFIAVCLTALFNAISPITLMMLMGLCNYSFKTYAGNDTLENLAKNTFPLYVYFKDSFLFGGRHTNVIPTKTLIFVAIAVVIITVLSLMLFKIRKSERAGSALAFYKTKAPLKCYLTLMAGYCMLFIFESLAGTVWGYIGIVLGVIISHAIIESLYNFDVRCIFKNVRTMAILVVVSIVFLVGMQKDIIGYDTKIPNEQDISGVYISTLYPIGNIDYHNSIRNKTPLTSAENIANTLKIAQMGIDSLDSKDIDTYYTTITSSQYADLNRKIYTSFDITYKLKNGNSMSRNYSVLLSDDFINALNNIILSKDYMEKSAESVFDIKLDDIKSTQLDVYTQSGTQSDVSASIRDIAHATEILNTLKEESLTLTKEQAQSVLPVLRLDADVYYYNSYKDELYEYYTRSKNVSYIPVYPSYTKTLALIEKYTGVTPKPLDANNIASIQIYITNSGSVKDKLTPEAYEKVKSLANDYGYTVSTTDKQVIQKLIQNAMLNSMAECASPLFEVDSTYTFDMEMSVTFNNSYSATITYKAGKIPFDVISSVITG